MNNIYKQYLNKLEIISEEDFVELLNSLPSFDTLEDDNYAIDDDPIVILFNYGVLPDTGFTLTYVDEDTKSIELECEEVLDDDTIVELKLLNKELSEKGWTIDNYDDLLKEIEEELEETDDDSRIELLKEISENATTEQLRRIVNSL